ncbi:hypothetical protein [Streptomyces sp. NBC_00454]|uniref:hypothetical protein n=1 Tax=Streptomyces sp. NBC_00454 TaxID=2975747 RepID=UPI00352E693E
MWRDESVTWQVAHRPLGALWELLGQVDAVHGLYYLLMHAVFAVAGGGADGASAGLWALRLPSVAATALAAAGVAAVAHRLAGAGGRTGEDGARREDGASGGRPPEGRAAADGLSAERPSGERPSGDQLPGDRPAADGLSGDGASRDGLSGERRAGDQPFGDRPAADRLSGERPSGEQPSGARRPGYRSPRDRPAAERAALFAGVGYAVLPPVQMYAQEGRSYALVAAAVIWATYLMLRERWVGYAVVLVLGCWLHEFAVLALPAHAFTAWRSRGWRWSAAAVVAGLLPLALVSARQAQQQLGWLGRPGWQDWAAYGVLAAAALLLAPRPATPGPSRGRVSRGLAAPAGSPGAPSGTGASGRPGARTHRTPNPDGPKRPAAEPAAAAARDLVRVALPLALLPPGVLLAVSLVHPWYVDRYVLYSLAGLALLAGTRLAQVRRPVRARDWWPWLLAAALLVPVGFWSAWLRTPESRKDDALAVAAAVRERAWPGDAVLFMPSRRREWLLSSPEVYGSLRDPALSRTPAASRSLQGVERTAQEIREALLDPSTERVVALLDPSGQPLDGDPAEAVKRQTLVSSFDLCSVTQVRGARVALFAKPGGCR